MHPIFTIVSNTCVGGQMGMLEQSHIDLIIKHGSIISYMRPLKQQSLYSMNLFNHFIFQDLLKAAIPELNGSIKKGEQFAADYKN